MSNQELEVASPAWLDAVANVLRDIMSDAVAAGEIPDDANFSMCEVYTDVPGRVSDIDRVAWHCRLTGPELHIAFEEIDDADLKIVGDWATIAPTASVEYDLTDPSSIPPDISTRMMSAVAEGKLVMTLNGITSAPPAFLQAHNRIAKFTK